MKKFIKIIFVLVIGIMFIPTINAKEIPKEGVTYFLEYPDGSENAVDTYNEAISIKEKLLFDGYTNNEGNIVLNGWNDKGELRVLQFVPEGYTTNVKEIKLDLASTSMARFIDYNGLMNFVEGRNALILLSLVVIIGSGVLLSKKKKKSLMIIPIAFIALSFYSVKAWNNSFIITIEDEEGNALKNTRVQIYGKPTIEVAPAIKFISNGGTFFDGTTEKYYKIPYEGCSYSEFLDTLTEEEYYYLYDNLEYAYLDGYTRVLPDTNVELKNGRVISLEWVPNTENQVVEIDGNGGVYNFHNNYLEKISFYNNMNMKDRVNDFKRTGYFYIGKDNNKACTNYNEYGLRKNTTIENSNKEYLCWNKKPDGIYVNDILLLGNIDTCFKESKAKSIDDTFVLSKDNHNVEFTLTNDEKVKIYYYLNDNSVDSPSETINLVRVVYHGEVILAIPAKILSLDNDYTITDSSKSKTLYQYLDELRYNSCF